MEALAQIAAARPYTMTHGDYPFASDKDKEIDMNDIKLRTSLIQNDDALVTEISEKFNSCGLDNLLPSPRNTDQFASESIDIFLDYVGLNKVNPSVNLTWTNRLVKNNISVDTSVVESSTWQALKATTYINADKYAIQRLIFDNKRASEYDDMVDYIKVCTVCSFIFIFP